MPLSSHSPMLHQPPQSSSACTIFICAPSSAFWLHIWSFDPHCHHMTSLSSSTSTSSAEADVHDKVYCPTAIPGAYNIPTQKMQYHRRNIAQCSSKSHVVLKRSFPRSCLQGRGLLRPWRWHSGCLLLEGSDAAERGVLDAKHSVQHILHCSVWC